MDCKNSSLCIFDKPGVLTDIQERYFVEHFPVNTLTANGPIEFVLSDTSEDYFDLSQSKLYVKFKVLHEDGTNVKQADDIVGLNNLAIATLFSDATLQIGDEQIEGGNPYYPYLGYFRTVMQYDREAQKSFMPAMGWYKDEAGKFDDKANTGFVKRQSLVGDSKTIELMGPLYFDLFNQGQYLIHKTPLRVKLTPNRPEFLLNSYNKAKTKFKVEFEKAVLLMERVKLNPSVINGHALGMKKQNALYPVDHSKLMTYTVPKGNNNYIKDKLFPNLAPKFIMIALVDNSAFCGDIAKNPFNFQHFNVSRFVLSRDGRNVPSQPLKPDFANNNYLISYIKTMEAFGYWNSDKTNGMTMNEWGNGYTIYAFDMTPDREASGPCSHANLSSNIRLEIDFEKPLPSTINILVYAVTDSLIEITDLRDVIAHYKR